MNSGPWLAVGFLYLMVSSYCSSPSMPADNIASPPTDETAVATIMPPPGFVRHAVQPGTFAAFLQNMPLKKNKTVFLYNGLPKANQTAQYAVLDIPTGRQDLQQCADAVMRLRAGYLYAQKSFAAIRFQAGDGTWLSFEDWCKGVRYRLQKGRLVTFRIAPDINTAAAFEQYLQCVYTYCGTSTLPASLKRKKMTDLQAGDVLLKPGSPGHAVIVMDVVQDGSGKKRYLLAQSYMPAQDMHILNNPAGPTPGPWYTPDDSPVIQTPEWTFYDNQLYEWK